MNCKHIKTCSFIENGSYTAPFTAKMTRLKYCELIQHGCARYYAYQVLDADMVPDGLWPNEEIETLGRLERKIKETHKEQSKNNGEND
jgi:hypothetical protein